MKTSLQIVALLAAVAAAEEPQYLCSYYGNQLDCSGKDITQPPAGYWPDVKFLDLSATDIAAFYKNSFSGFPNLWQLRMLHTPLTELQMEVFVGANNLGSLILPNNRIQRVLLAPADVTFEYLTDVNLRENNFSSIDPDAFENAPNVQFVDLGGNPIVVPDGQPILIRESLSVLHWQSTKLGNLGPAIFAALPNLTELNLQSAEITNVSGAFVANEKLETLVLSYNDITEVTAGSFALSGSISTLWLDNNPLQRLDVAAVNGAMIHNSAAVTIWDTPLACACAYETLYWWAQFMGAVVLSGCGEMSCQCPFESCQQRTG